MGNVNKTVMSGGSSDFTPCPKGIYQAVLCDVVDLGYLEKMYNGESKGFKPHVQLVYQVNTLREEDGKPYLIFGRRDVLSFDDRANFFKDLSLMLGAERLAELMALDEWDTDMLIGTNCRMQVVHNQSDDGKRTYANIGAMFPWGESDGPLLTVRDYTRRCERDGWVDPVPSAFDDPAVAQHTIAEQKGQTTLNEHPNVTAAANLGKPAPVQTAPAPHPVTAAQTSPIKASQMDEIKLQARISWGEKCKGPLAVLIEEMFPDKELADLTADEAAQLISKLRSLPAHVKAMDDPAVPDDAYSVFADPGDANYRPPAVDPTQGTLVEGPPQRQVAHA